MPRKPRIKQERLGSPMRTRSSNPHCSSATTSKTRRTKTSCNTHSSSFSSKMPALASLIATAPQSSPIAPIETPALGKVAPATTPTAASPDAPTISPSCKESHPKRQKRETIKLPPSISLSTLSAKELRRLKNRISASRVRERSQQSQRQMEQQLEAFKQRCEFLESVVSGCPSCAVLSAVRFGEIELLPVQKEEQQENDLSEVLTEAECLVLGDVLHC